MQIDNFLLINESLDNTLKILEQLKTSTSSINQEQYSFLQTKAHDVWQTINHCRIESFNKQIGPKPENPSKVGWATL